MRSGRGRRSYGPWLVPVCLGKRELALASSCSSWRKNPAICWPDDSVANFSSPTSYPQPRLSQCFGFHVADASVALRRTVQVLEFPSSSLCWRTLTSPTLPRRRYRPLRAKPVACVGEAVVTPILAGLTATEERLERQIDADADVFLAMHIRHRWPVRLEKGQLTGSATPQKLGLGIQTCCRDDDTPQDACTTDRCLCVGYSLDV